MIPKLWQRLGASSRRLTSGFTLVELMVAVTGGLFVSMAVFMLAKQATGLYQSESRVSNATLGSVVGFERLRMDIERASFLASPNLLRDPKMCGIPGGGWPAYLQRMTGVFIQPTASGSIPQELKDNGVKPDEIVLAGSYTSIDQFPTTSIDGTGGASHIVTLQTASGPMARLGFNDPALTAAQRQALLASVFGIGRALRIVDTSGWQQYGTITAVVASPDPVIELAITGPPILYRGSSTALKCGVMGNGKDHLVNVVNFVKYSIKSMDDTTKYPGYIPLYSAGVGGGTSGVPATDAHRGELVREELDTAGVTIAGSEEVVSEFAVDLQFGVTVNQVTTPATGSPVEQLLNIAPGAAGVLEWAGSPLTMDLTTHGPQRVRALRARLSVRSRAADRLSGMPDGGGFPISGGLYRVALGGAAGKAPFARVRTMQSDVALRNHRGVIWL